MAEVSFLYEEFYAIARLIDMQHFSLCPLYSKSTHADTLKRSHL